MTAQDYWKVVIPSTPQDDDDRYTDSQGSYTCPVSWLDLVMVHVNPPKIKESYPYISAETLFNMPFLSRITFLYGFILLTQKQWIRIINLPYNFEAYLHRLVSL